MPKDVLLTSLIEDNTSDDVSLTYENANSRDINEIEMKNLTPPELEEQYKLEFMQYLEFPISENQLDLIYSGNQSFFSTHVESKMVNDAQIQISKEHSYCKR